MYSDIGQFAHRLRQLGREAHNDLVLRYHNSHRARDNAVEYLPKEKVKFEKYFYILQLLLAIRYIEQELGRPPVRSQELVEAVAPLDIQGTIAELIQLKQITLELGVGVEIPLLNDFIFLEL